MRAVGEERPHLGDVPRCGDVLGTFMDMIVAVAVKAG